MMWIKIKSKIKKEMFIIILFAILLSCIIGKYYNVDDKNIYKISSNLITVSTVFVGFTFTSMSLLIGLNSENLIRKLRHTHIILRELKLMMLSINCFIISTIVFLIFICKFYNLKYIISFKNEIYFLGIELLILGIIFFIIAVYRLSDLVINVYSYNESEANKRIASIKEQYKNNKQDNE